MRKNIIITGLPKSGKSTLLKRIISNYNPKVGFITNEIRENGERVGFEIETNSGTKSMLAHVNFKTDFKVSKYYIQVKNLDAIIPQVNHFNESDLLYLDEIGQMELISELFKQLVLKYFNSSNTCLATLSKVYEDEFTSQLKQRQDMILVEITAQNRAEQEVFITALIKKIAKARRYAQEPTRFTIKSDKVTMKTDHGIKHLTRQHNHWQCDCDFFQKYHLCSHLLAWEEIQKKD